MSACPQLRLVQTLIVFVIMQYCSTFVIAQTSELKTVVELNKQAVKLYKQGQHGEAIRLLERALALNEKVLGPNHIRVALSLDKLGVVYHASGNYSKAEAMIKRALPIKEKTLGPEHPSVLICLNNLAEIYRAQGNYIEAIHLHKRVLSIKEKTLKPGHPDIALSLNNLASLYQTQGDLAESEPLYKRALTIWETTHGQEHPDYAEALNNLGLLYISLGDYAKAETMFNRALDIKEKIFGPEHLKLANTLNNLSELYSAKGEYNKAEPLCKRSVAIREKFLGSDHLYVAEGLNNLAVLYNSMEEFDKAEPLFKRALKIKEKVFGPEHLKTASTLNNLAILYITTGNYNKAENLLKRALNITENILGREHPNFASSLSNLSLIHAARGDFKKAHDLNKEFQRIDDQIIDQVLDFISGDRKLMFLTTRRSFLESSISLVVQHMQGNIMARKDILDWWLQRKGIVLESQRRFQESLVYSDNPEAIKTLQKLALVRAELSRLVFSGPSKAGVKAYKKKIKELNEKKETLENHLIQLSQTFAKQRKKAGADTSKIIKYLPHGAALIEFARIRYYNFNARGKEDIWQSPHYLAFVLHAGKDNQVELIDLGEANRIDNAIDKFKNTMYSSRKEKQASFASRRLHDLVFAPIKEKLGSSNDIFISPDGNLNLIPFEVLQDPNGGYLLEKYSFNYLASGRDILGFGLNQGKKSKSILIGDPDYDLAVSDTNQYEMDSRRSADMRGLSFDRLPGALEEVKAIQNIIGPNKAKLITGPQAVEAVLINARSPEVLHFATHGFFLTDQQLEYLVYRSDNQSAPQMKSVVNKIQFENPLLRSGLALAGANQVIKGNDANQSSGLLTAEKVLGLRLQGTDLVVLSACNTGTGEVKNGEGVYGLRRAFVQAGTKGLVMSMWAVPDKETKELMIQFYANMFRNKMSPRQALRNAALNEMKIVKKRYGHTHPMLWGAFIYLGEPN